MKKKPAPKPVEKKSAPTTNLEHCNYGVHWDAAATEAVQTVAEGLLANAKAMDKLIDVFKAQNVQINNMLHIN